MEYGELIVNSKEDEDQSASEVLVCMLVGLKGSWKWPIGYFLQNKSNANIQEPLIKSAIQLSTETGWKMHGITFDGTRSNFATAQALGCQTRGELNKLSLKYEITGNPVCIIPDAGHMMKLARTCISTLGESKSPQSTIKWSYIKELNDLKNCIGFKCANELSRAHVQYTLNKMKVKLAAQTMRDPLLLLQKSCLKEFQGVPLFTF